MTEYSPEVMQMARANEPRLLPHPESCPGTYVMHFYCKYSNPAHPFQPGGHFMEEAVDVETRGAAIAQMRRAGWIYHRDGTATCNICATALRTFSHLPTVAAEKDDG